VVAEVLEREDDLPEWLQSQPPAVPAPLRHHLIRTDLAEQLERRKTNEYRYLSAHELKTQQEYWGWMLIEYGLRSQALPDADFSYSIYVARSTLELIERAMTRLKHLEQDAGRHPRMSADPHGGIDYSRVKELISIDALVSKIAWSQATHRTGSRYKVQCMLPGHTDDNTPSFTVYLDQESCWCFGCGRGGDVIELAGHWFGQVNGAIATELLCGLMGVPVPRVPGRQPVRTTAETASAMACVGPGDRVVSFNASRLARGRRRGR
jgi:hypothetical protein